MATKKEQPEKKRRGKAVKPKKGEAAKFEAGGAAPPKHFDAAEIAEKLHLWWEDGGGQSFIVGQNPAENGVAQTWSCWPEKKVVNLLKLNYVRLKPREGERLSEAEQVLMYVMQHRRVDGVMWGIAGYQAGLHVMPSGERLIVRNSPGPVQPKSGDWSLVKELIEGRLDLWRDENIGEPERPRNVPVVEDQVLYFHAWHRSALHSLLHGSPGSWTQRRLLALCGPVGCGKSRLQVMVTNGLLGGRVANPKMYLIGRENFNANMVKAEHLMMEELDNVSQKMVDRLAFSEAIKAVVANTGVTLRLMRTDPMTITPFWAPTLSMNNDPDKLRSFPPLTPDFRDKVIMLLVRRAPLPMPTRTDEEKKAFNSAVAAQLPAYAHWLLNEFEVPKELLVDEHGEDATRFGCRPFQHHTLATELFEDSPSAELLNVIDAASFGADTKIWDLASDAKVMGESWQGSAIELERLLMGEVPDWQCSAAREAKRLFTHSRCERLLGRLGEDRPDRVMPKRTSIKRGWAIFPPSH
jgi:hypothetical protein